MNLESTINRLYEAILADSGSVFNIKDSQWVGYPWSSSYYGNPTTFILERRAFWLAAEENIELAPLEICLTSPSEYIREYRKYYESRK